MRLKLVAISCQECEGTGAKGGITTQCLAYWFQTGKIRQQIGPFVQDSVRSCPNCMGSGRTFKDRCKSYAGEGIQSESQVLRFNIPVGAQDGTRLRMQKVNLHLLDEVFLVIYSSS